LFGVSIVQVINLDNSLARQLSNSIRKGLAEIPPSFNGWKKARGDRTDNWKSRMGSPFSLVLLRGKLGDWISALMRAVGYNFCKLLRAFACLVFFNLRWSRIKLARLIGSCETGIGDSLMSLFPTQIRMA
jgi:hypothetical protein